MSPAFPVDSVAVSPSTPPVATPAPDTPDVGISASSSVCDAVADYPTREISDKMDIPSVCTQLEPDSITVPAPPPTGQLLADVQMAEQPPDEVADEHIAPVANTVTITNGHGDPIVIDEEDRKPQYPISASTPSFSTFSPPPTSLQTSMSFPLHSDSMMEDQPPPAKRARKNSGPSESRLTPILANGHVNGHDLADVPFILSPAQFRFAMSTLRSLKKSKDAGPFLLPVDPVAFNIPHYPNIIKHPMDFSTVEQKLTASNPLKATPSTTRYHNVDQFVADVHLIFSNCVTFNGPEHPVSQMGKRIEAIFEKQLKNMPPNEEIKPVAPKPPPPAPPKKVTARRPSTSMPTIRRSDNVDGQVGAPVRPKREIHPPAPKDLPYADAPKKGRSGRGKRRRDDGTGEQLKFCGRLLNELFKKQYYNIASPFYDPVDYVKLDLPTYPKIIKKPMDMSTIRKKLEGGEYSDAGQFHTDFSLMFRNCAMFNPVGTPVSQAGIELQVLFRDKWQALPPLRPLRDSDEEDEEESDDEQARAIAMMESQIETMRSSITALKKKPKKDKKSRHGGSGLPGSSKNGNYSGKSSSKNGKKKHHRSDDDVLTFDQKKALSETIQTLEGARLEKVISIIHEGVPEIRDSTEEIELDIDSLPATVLQKLYAYVLKPKVPKSHRSGLGSRSVSGGLKRKSMDEEAETEKIKLLEDKMKLFNSGGVNYGGSPGGDDSGSGSDSSSDSDSASDGSDD